jgi:hypothetical protein
MSVVEKSGIEGVAPENEQIQVPEDQKQEVNESQKSERTNDSDKNWRQAREIMDRQQKEIEELKKASKAPKSTEEEIELSDDDVLTVREHRIRTDRQLEDKFISWQNEQVEKKTMKLSDFQDVIKYVDDFVAENPSAESAIRSSSTPRATAYELVKSWYKYREMKANKEESDESKKVKENLTKPQNGSSSYSSAPLNDINSYKRMTKERMAEIRRLSDEYASRR